jgi:glycerophosphoryl diester phosphodiesterase
MRTTLPIVIAHRGACGYLPEHTLAAKALAHAMHADFIEQDVVLTKDSVPIVLHDVHLDSTTNVAIQFPKRHREDGHFYAMDFSLDEIRTLRAHERRVPSDKNTYRAVYPNRFPVENQDFAVLTLEEEIDFIEGLNQHSKHTAGFYIEFKGPNKHKAAGLDLPGTVMQLLEEKGLADKPGKVFLQCFDDKTLQRLARDYQTPLPLIQLIADNSWNEDSSVDYDFLRTREGLDYITTYAQGIGPWLSHIYTGKDKNGEAQLQPLVGEAQERGLMVHPYTFRKDDLPAGIDNFDELLHIFLDELGVDGVFSDFPDLVTEHIHNMAAEK